VLFVCTCKRGAGIFCGQLTDVRIRRRADQQRSQRLPRVNFLLLLLRGNEIENPGDSDDPSPE
jgi:hypothetical protein